MLSVLHERVSGERFKRRCIHSEGELFPHVPISAHDVKSASQNKSRQDTLHSNCIILTKAGMVSDPTTHGKGSIIRHFW